jgi:hypothetical protein
MGTSGSYTTWLAAGAGMSAAAAVLHLAIIVGGAPWYRFFGAGERMARAAEAGRRFPALVTLGIAAMLFVWAAYALSGAGLAVPLPFLKFALIAIATVYTLRGLVIVPLMLVAVDKMTSFAVWSSLICLAYGVVHVVGLALLWPHL